METVAIYAVMPIAEWERVRAAADRHSVRSEMFAAYALERGAAVPASVGSLVADLASSSEVDETVGVRCSVDRRLQLTVERWAGRIGMSECVLHGLCVRAGLDSALVHVVEQLERFGRRPAWP